MIENSLLNAENRTRGCWVWSRKAINGAMRPPSAPEWPKVRFSYFFTFQSFLFPEIFLLLCPGRASKWMIYGDKRWKFHPCIERSIFRTAGFASWNRSDENTWTCKWSYKCRDFCLVPDHAFSILKHNPMETFPLQWSKTICWNFLSFEKFTTHSSIIL